MQTMMTSSEMPEISKDLSGNATFDTLENCILDIKMDLLPIHIEIGRFVLLSKPLFSTYIH